MGSVLAIDNRRRSGKKRQPWLGRFEWSMRERLGPEHYGEERAETQTKRAERIIVEELKTRKWRERELRQSPKGDGEKVAIARRLRAETVMTVSWISQRLHLGSRNYANLLLSKSGEQPQHPDVTIARTDPFTMTPLLPVCG